MAASCEICGDPTHHPRAYACPRCKKILDRIETRKNADGTGRGFDRAARIQAMKEAWWDGAFHCFYTGVKLVTSDWRDHRYLAFEHRSPGDESSVVVAANLINRMKTDMSETEFRQLVKALARRFDGEPFDRAAFPQGKGPAPVGPDG